MVIADNEISAPKSPKKSNYWKKPGVDVPVLVVGTKSWPALSDAQTPKPMNHVENVSVPSVGQVASRAPSVQKSISSGNFNPKNKMPSPRYRKPGPKRSRNTNGTPHFPVATMPYPNGENPKPVSPAAAGQGFTPPAHAFDAKHVQPPVQGDPNAYAVNYPNGRPYTQEQGDHVNHGRHHQRPFPAKANMPMHHNSHQIDLNEPVSVQDPSEHSMEQQQEKTGTDISESGHAVAILNSNDNNLVQAESGAEGSNEANLVQAESVQEGSREAKRRRRERERWTEGEHKLFLEGLEKYGKGRWKDISKECVVTKTPIQIASHAQKYFVHQNVKDIEKRKKRRSIHDTTLNKNDTSVTEIPSVENELTPLVTAPMEEQHENPPLVTPTMEQHKNPPQDTDTSRQMQLVLLCPIGSTLPDMNKLEKMRNLFNLLAKEL